MSAGWHPDPAGGDGLRWFDGRRWTDAVRPGHDPGVRRRVRVLLVVVLAVVVSFGALLGWGVTHPRPSSAYDVASKECYAATASAITRDQLMDQWATCMVVRGFSPGRSR